MILDSEVLLIDNKTGKPLPFGTLGVHKVKKKLNKKFCVCVFGSCYSADLNTICYQRIISELWCSLEHLGKNKIIEKAHIEKLKIQEI